MMENVFYIIISGEYNKIKLETTKQIGCFANRRMNL